MWETFPEIIRQHAILSSAVVLLVIVIITLVQKSIYTIGPTEVGLVRKRYGAPLPEDNPVAFHGEAGYQADLLMPGLRFKSVLVYAVTKYPPGCRYRLVRSASWSPKLDSLCPLAPSPRSIPRPLAISPI